MRQFSFEWQPTGMVVRIVHNGTGQWRRLAKLQLTVDRARPEAVDDDVLREDAPSERFHPSD
jgi:hypothetical protein